MAFQFGSAMSLDEDGSAAGAGREDDDDEVSRLMIDRRTSTNNMQCNAISLSNGSDY